MANAQIYQKTIDPSVQNGLDKSLILDPNAFYQRKFTFGDDWNEIKLGIFLSYTNSITDNNKDFIHNTSVSSGATTPDTYSWFGVIREKNPKVLPVEGDFIGTRWNELRNTNENLLHYVYNTISDDAGTGGSGTRGQIDIATSNGTVLGTHAGASNSTGHIMYLPYTQISNQNDFATYIGIKILVSNKGLPTQTVEYIKYRHSSNSTTFSNLISDISLTNLKEKINSAVYLATTTTFQFNKDGEAIPLPDSIFFYNAFLSVRPRIHAIAVKKIS